MESVGSLWRRGGWDSQQQGLQWLAERKTFDANELTRYGEVALVQHISTAVTGGMIMR